MRKQPKTIWNMAANVAGIVVNMVSGLLVMPFLIQKLGNTTYGLWILIGTLTGYFGVLDLGVSAAVGRLIAVHRARREPDEVNAVMSTAFSLLLIVSGFVIVATYVSLWLFPTLFSVPAASAADVRFSLILVGCNLALAFPGSVFGGLLWGYERFDLQNAVDIPALTLRTILTLTLVGTASPLTNLATIVLVVSVAGAACKALICYNLVPHLQVSFAKFRTNKVREIFSIGSWLSVISWSRTLIPQIAPTLIGNRLGSAAVTTFTVARQLVVYANIFAISATQVMTPGATGAFALNATGTQRRLFIEGGKFSYALTLFFTAGLFILGAPFIHWWQHGLQDAAYHPLLILTLGEALPMSQWLTYSVLSGAGRQRNLGLLALSEGVTAFPLIIVLTNRHGITGACIGVALSAFFARGLFQLLYGCRLLKISLRSYVAEVFAPVTLAALPSVVALYFAASAFNPRTFVTILASGVGFAILFAGSLALSLLGYGQLKTMIVTSLHTTEDSR